MYQQVNLADGTLVGAPGPLPANLIGLSDAVLADLSAAIAPAPPGLAGQGFWPVTIVSPVGFDPVAQVLVPPATFAANSASNSVSGTATAQSMSIAEFAAANPGLVSISRWRFFMGLLNGGFISQADMLNGVQQKAVPAPMATIISSMPSVSQQSATVLVLGSPTFDITHPFVAIFQQAQQPPLTDAQVIALWRAAAAL